MWGTAILVIVLLTPQETHQLSKTTVQRFWAYAAISYGSWLAGSRLEVVGGFRIEVGHGEGVSIAGQHLSVFPHSWRWRRLARVASALLAPVQLQRHSPFVSSPTQVSKIIWQKAASPPRTHLCTVPTCYTACPPQVFPSRRRSGSYTTFRGSCLQTAHRSVQPFLHSSPACPSYATCDRCSREPYVGLRTECRWCWPLWFNRNRQTAS